MTLSEPMLLQLTAQWGLLLLTGGMGLALYRMVRGPKNADRIIALDLLSVLVVAAVALFSVFSREKMFLDVAIAFALVAFLGTVAFARYLERSASHRPQEDQSGDEGGSHE